MTRTIGNQFMAIQQDKLHKALGGITIDDRFITWLWFFLRSIYPQSNLGEYKSFGMTNKMSDFISSNIDLAQTIEQQKKLYLLPSIVLRWITDDETQHIWITKQVIKKGWKSNRLIPQFEENNDAAPDNLNDRDRIIAMIDIWSLDPFSKNNEINSLKTLWIQHKQKIQIYDWFLGADEIQKLILAWDLTSKRHPSLTDTNLPFKTHQELLNIFDSASLHEAEKTLLIDSIKKRWSQNQYRENMIGKKQYNFILSEKTIARLDKLADTFDLRRVEVLDILLKMEENEGCYLPKGLKPRIND